MVIQKKIEDFIINNKHRLIQQDQTILNVVMQDRIAPFPPKFGIWAFSCKEEKRVTLSSHLTATKDLTTKKE